MARELETLLNGHGHEHVAITNSDPRLRSEDEDKSRSLATDNVETKFSDFLDSLNPLTRAGIVSAKTHGDGTLFNSQLEEWYRSVSINGFLGHKPPTETPSLAVANSPTANGDVRRIQFARIPRARTPRVTAPRARESFESDGPIVLSPSSEESDEIELIEIDDDSPENTQSALETNDDQNKDRSSFYICFFCGQVLEGPTDFVNHMERHLEYFEKCPLCLMKNLDQPLKHSLHAIDHLLEMHMRTDNDDYSCPCCLEPFGEMGKLKNIYNAFKHVVFDCLAQTYCFLCAGDADGKLVRLPKNQREHYEKEHAYVYNRLFCSVCMSGFPSRIGFDLHDCRHILRCRCNLSVGFNTTVEYSRHLKANHVNCRLFNPPNKQTCSIFIPAEYRKTLEAKRILAWSSRCGRSTPSMNDLHLFLNKYMFLCLRRDQLPDNLNAEPPFKSSCPRPAQSNGFHSPSLSAATTPPSVLPSPIRIRNSTLETTQKQRPSELSLIPTQLSAPVKKLDKLIARTRKRKRVDETPQNPQEIRLESAKMEVSDVWIWREKLNVSVEIAEIVEDLVFSTCDPAIRAANGISMNSFPPVS
ncbi:hypothetical protein M3Y94_00476200 [Aphelenchoides besseyi]|nr:hypothetical protein M3Y94_00476200 [Aphelenchoides besseyi]KAI6219924.1 hypothetical protein M3Y95_01079000 [Aphelenchoides besseyi]